MKLSWWLAMCWMVAVGLAACATKHDVVVDTRLPATVTEVRYVRVPQELTAPTPIAEGSITEAVDVARERKSQLQQCNADKAAIGGIQGTKTPC